MKKYEIHLADWQRILFGQAPPIFLLEVFVRTLIIYLLLLFVLRWLGKRMSGQITILEMVIMLTLGAIVSVGMQVPDRGILLSLIVLVCTVIFHKGLSWSGVKSARVEELTHGRISTLLVDGVMCLDEMKRCRISRQQLMSELRSSGIFSLGQVRRVYLEAYGLFSIIRAHGSQPGLCTLPPDDSKVLELLNTTSEMTCINCGTVGPYQPLSKECPTCGNKQWTKAYLAK